MCKVVFLSINAKYVHSSLAVWLLAAGVSRYSKISHDVKVVEATINRNVEDIAAQVAGCAPDVVGISTYIWNAGKLPELLVILRERLPDAVFVLGGPEATHNPEYWLANGADYVLRGEGERSFSALLDMLCGGASPQSVPGLCLIQNGEIFLSPESPPVGDYVDPYSTAYFAALSGRIAYIETSRGCPFKCAFCLSGGSGARFFPLDAAKERICKLSESGAGTIKFVDRTFNCNPERAYELFEYVIGLDTQCCFHFEVAPDLFDSRTLSLLGGAPPGRIQLEAGLQSFFGPALKASSRQTDIAAAEENIRALISGGNIHIHVDLIAGLPFETLSDFQNSFDRAYALGAHTLQIGFLKLLHGSALRKEATSIVCAKDPPYEILRSPWMDADDLNILRQTENALQNTYNKGRFLSSLEYALPASGLRPFDFYRKLGNAAQNHATPLELYAEKIYSHLVKLPEVDPDELKSRMICDWLAMVKGKNMPSFLKIREGRRQVAAIAEERLGRRIGRSEAAVLPSGKGVFADILSRDPVSGLYDLYVTEILPPHTRL